jgi:hypothetical protein
MTFPQQQYDWEIITATLFDNTNTSTDLFANYSHALESLTGNQEFHNYTHGYNNNATMIPNAMHFPPKTPMPWRHDAVYFPLDEKAQAPMQGQNVQTEDLFVTRAIADDIDSVFSFPSTPPMDSAKSGSASTDEESTPKKASPKRPRDNQEEEPKVQKGAPKKKARQTAPKAPKAAAARKKKAKKTAKKTEKKKTKVEFVCDAKGEVHITVFPPKKHLKAYFMFTEHQNAEFEKLIFELAKIDRTIELDEGAKSSVHLLLDAYVKLATPCPEGTTDEYNLHTRKFLMIPNEFFESVDDADKLQQFCNGTHHLTCVACPGSSFTLRSNMNGYVACDGDVTKHQHDHNKCAHALALAMIKADLVKVDVVKE